MGVTVIVNTLQGGCSCASLRTLDIRGNTIGVEGVKAIGSVLLECKLLKELDLSAEGIGNEEFKAIMDGMCTNMTVIELSLGRCHISNETTKAITRMLLMNTTLHSLELVSLCTDLVVSLRDNFRSLLESTAGTKQSHSN